MIPVEQVHTAPPDGDCMRACLASILELPLEDVPNYHGSTWAMRYQEWLNARNLMMLTWAHSDGQDGQDAVTETGYAILCAKSPRGDYNHAVVTYAGEIVWDPSPHRDDGIGSYVEWTILVPLDPAKLIGVPA